MRQNEDIASLERRFDEVTSAFINKGVTSIADKEIERSTFYNTGNKFMFDQDEYLKEGGQEMTEALDQFTYEVEHDFQRLAYLKKMANYSVSSLLYLAVKNLSFVSLTFICDRVLNLSKDLEFSMSMLADFEKKQALRVSHQNKSIDDLKS